MIAAAGVSLTGVTVTTKLRVVFSLASVEPAEVST